MDKPIAHVVYSTTDARNHRDPVDAANHELLLQIDGFLEAFIGRADTFTRFEIIDLLRGKRKELSEILSFDYTPERMVPQPAPVPAARPAWPSPPVQPQFAPQSAPPPPQKPAPAQKAAPHPYSLSELGLTDEELAQAIKT